MQTSIKKYRNSIEDSAIAYFLIQATGNIVYCNQSALAMFAFKKKEEIYRTTIKNLVSKDLKEFFPQEISEEYYTNGKFSNQVSATKDGNEFLSLVSIRDVIFSSPPLIEVQITHREKGEDADIEKEKLSQTIEMLKCELNAERRRSWSNNNISLPMDSFLVDRLTNLYPDLSPSKQSLGSLILHNYDTTEVANKLNISISSVYTARKRLRQHLEIPQGESILSFLNKLMK